MRLLLDTHALIWWWLDDAKLPERVRAVIADEANEVFVSAASAWEMAIKHRAGKLGSIGSALPRFHALIAGDGFIHLPMDGRHALKAGALASEHRDPFDRMLAAQAELEGLTLLSADAALAELSNRVSW
jgi:Uncharacterized protein conserved in bacteria